MEIPALHQPTKTIAFAIRSVDRWVSLYAFCEPHRSAIGTVIAVGAVMEIPALHQPTRTQPNLQKTIALPIRSVDLNPTYKNYKDYENYSF